MPLSRGVELFDLPRHGGGQILRPMADLTPNPAPGLAGAVFPAPAETGARCGPSASEGIGLDHAEPPG